MITCQRQDLQIRVQGYDISKEASDILTKTAILMDPQFPETTDVFSSNSSICAASLRSQMVSECSAGATVNTCQAVFYQHFILSINKINSINTLHNASFP